MKKKDLPFETVTFVPVSALFPEEWQRDIWQMLTEAELDYQGSFNAHALVDAGCLVEFLEDEVAGVEDLLPGFTQWCTDVRAMGEFLVDLGS